MDLGDVIRLIIFGIIFLSFFGRFLKRENAEDGRPVGPTDLSQSGGGPEARPLVAESREATFADEATAPSQRRREESRKRYQTSTSLPEPMSRPQARREEALERGPSAGSLMTADGDPGRRPPRPKKAKVRRQHPATGGDVLRRSLKDPDTLERAFIVKEVLDLPIGLRQNAS